jgi:hypothetical protein
VPRVLQVLLFEGDEQTCCDTEITVQDTKGFFFAVISALSALLESLWQPPPPPLFSTMLSNSGMILATVLCWCARDSFVRIVEESIKVVKQQAFFMKRAMVCGLIILFHDHNNLKIGWRTFENCP